MSIPTDSQDTADLLVHIASGDSAALERLLELHRPYLNRLVRMRIEPALSDPVESVVVPDAAAAPAPPDEAPQVMSKFQGLRVTPQSLEWV